MEGSEELHPNFKHISVLLLNGMFPGHLFPLVSLGEELVKRGHNVTLCSTVMEGTKLLPSVPESVGVRFLSAGPDNFTQDDYVIYMKAMQDMHNRPSLFKKVVYSGKDAAIKIRNALELVGPENFDIIVCDFSVLHVGLYYAVLGKPVIIFSSFLPPYPAIPPPWPTPITVTGSQTEDLGFLERLINPIISLMFLPLWKDIFESILEMDTNFAKVLSDVNFVRFPGIYIPHIVTSVIGFEIPTLLSPLRHYVGPVLKGSPEQLNEDLDSWLTTKQNRSVLYISMGTTGDVSRTKAEALVQAVQDTGYDALWALRRDSIGALDGIEIDQKKFMIKNWVPQQTVLQHPAIKACILHCGLNSVQESLYNGLPVICLPHAFDQFQVGSTIRNIEVGTSMYSFWDSLTGNRNVSAADMTEAIQTVTTDKYVENAKRLSLMYKFAGGAKRAVDLVEFYEDVGYDHLIPAFAKYNWSWVQYYNVDVHAILIVLLCTLLYCGYRCIKCACCCFCRQKPNSASKAKTD